MTSRTAPRARARALLAGFCVAALTAGAGVVASPASAMPSGGEGRFIITVADAYDSRTVAAEHRRKGAEIDFVYTAALNGFAGSMSQAELGELQRDRRVTRIERDGIATASETTQTNATWGLDRIDQRALPLSTTFTYTPTGSGVHAYIIDTGIRRSHADFGARVTTGSADYYDAFGGTGEDCDGHGTHVAGTVGAATYGVAKAVTLYPVRVLDCSGSGTWSGVIAGVDWVANNGKKPGVANMSLGGGASSSVDAAVDGLINKGISVVVAAGNGNQGGKEQDACGYSPARVPRAITIGATTQSDAKTSWSNYGECVDLFAPGYQITSAWYTDDTATGTISGTSMAAPHVAGVAALYLQNNATATPQQVRDAVYNTSTKGVVTSSKTANNHLVFSGLTTPTANTAPVASFTYSCIDLACSFDGSGSSDSEGAIAGYAWTFGDGASATGVAPKHTYAAAGTYTVTLTVTDGAGATGTSSRSVSVSTTPTGGFSLGATGYKVKGFQTVDLTWSGATSTDVDVYRDGSKVATTANDGADTDNIGNKGGGSYTYQVCEAGATTTCSNAVTVTF